LGAQVPRGLGVLLAAICALLLAAMAIIIYTQGHANAAFHADNPYVLAGALVLYALLAARWLPQWQFGRWLLATLALALAHGVSSALIGVVASLVVPGTAIVQGLREALWQFLPLVVCQIVFVPLLVYPLRDLLLPSPPPPARKSLPPWPFEKKPVVRPAPPFPEKPRAPERLVPPIVLAEEPPPPTPRPPAAPAAEVRAPRIPGVPQPFPRVEAPAPRPPAAPAEGAPAPRAPGVPAAPPRAEVAPPSPPVPPTTPGVPPAPPPPSRPTIDADRELLEAIKQRLRARQQAAAAAAPPEAAGVPTVGPYLTPSAPPGPQPPVAPSIAPGWPPTPVVEERPPAPPPEPIPPPLPPGGVVRVSLAKIAAQFPQGALATQDLGGVEFAVPMTTLAAQLREGAVVVPISEIVPQLPAATFALSEEDLAAALPGGKVELPLDEVFAQMPPAFFVPAHAAPAREALAVEGGVEQVGIIPIPEHDLFAEPVEPEAAPPPPVEEKEFISVPLSALLSQFPANAISLRDPARADEIQVRIGQARAVEQLKEGAVSLPVQEVLAQIPPDVLAMAPGDVAEAVAEGSIALPMEHVLAALPREAWAAPGAPPMPQEAFEEIEFFAEKPSPEGPPAPPPPSVPSVQLMPQAPAPPGPAQPPAAPAAPPEAPTPELFAEVAPAVPPQADLFAEPAPPAAPAPELLAAAPPAVQQETGAFAQAAPPRPPAPEVPVEAPPAPAEPEGMPSLEEVLAQQLAGRDIEDLFASIAEEETRPALSSPPQVGAEPPSVQAVPEGPPAPPARPPAVPVPPAVPSPGIGAQAGAPAQAAPSPAPPPREPVDLSSLLKEPSIHEALAGLRQFGALTSGGQIAADGSLVIVAAAPSEGRGAIAEGSSLLVARASSLGQVLGLGENKQIFISLERSIMAVSPFGTPRLTGLLAVIVPRETVAGLLSVKVERAAETVGVALARSPLASQVAPLSPAAPPAEPASPLLLPPEAAGVIRRAANALDSFGELSAQPVQVAQRRLVCYLPPGASVESVAGLAAAVYESVESCCARLMAGKVQRLSVRAERGTMMWQQLPNNLLLLVAGAGEVRPGLAHLQLDRVAGALGAARIA